MEIANTKGIGFVNARAFVVEKGGESAWADVLARLTPEDRLVLASVVPVGWYPVSTFARMLRAIEAAHGRGDFGVTVQIGKMSAERDLTRIHRIFLRMLRPSYAVEKVFSLWPRDHNTGRWNVEESSPRHIVVRLEDWGGNVDVIMCHNSAAYVVRMFELAGARNVTMEHPTCGALGGPACVYRARWGPIATADAPAEAHGARVDGVR